MVFWECSLLTGVDASAAQNSSVTKTCSQCGRVLACSVRGCDFCDSSFSVGPSAWEDSSNVSVRERVDLGSAGIDRSERPLVLSPQIEQDAAWRGELAQRLDAYRSRRRKLAPNAAQSQFSFDTPGGKTQPRTSLAVEDPPASVEADFSFSIAIGRPAKKDILEESRMVIYVSLPPDSESNPQAQGTEHERKSRPSLHPLAPMHDQRLPALFAS